MFAWVFSFEAWVALLSLTALEIVLGVDNILFISILTDGLPEKNKDFARQLGLGLALLGRLLLLFSVAWVMTLNEPLFVILAESISIRDLILMGGGLFLLAKSTTEIHDNLEGINPVEEQQSTGTKTFASVITQVILLDTVFSIDSVITAIGLVENITIIVISMLTAMGVMILSVNTIGEFIERHPSFKMLALSFLLLVGMILTVEGMGIHVPKGYIYFAMAFSASVEFLNLNVRKGKKRVHLQKQPEAKKAN